MVKINDYTQIGLLLLQVIAFVALTYQIKQQNVQLKLQAEQLRRNESVVKFQQIFDIQARENSYREYFALYESELDSIYVYIQHPRTTRRSFFEEFSHPNYHHLRTLVYFYETLGALIKNDAVNQDLLFDLINFPDELYERTQKLRSDVRVRYDYPDFLIHFDLYFEFVMIKRQKNRNKDQRSSGESISTTIVLDTLDMK